MNLPQKIAKVIQRSLFKQDVGRRLIITKLMSDENTKCETIHYMMFCNFFLERFTVSLTLRVAHTAWIIVSIEY